MSARRLAFFLLAGTAVSTSALAQNTAGSPATPRRLVTHPEGQPTVANDTETVNVVGRRQSPGGGLMVHETAAKQVDAVTRAFIEKQSPSNNAMQLLKLSPGANVATSDPYGLTNNNITVRGLNQDEMGWTLEGAPINDMGNYAIYINEWGDTENFQQVQLQSGSADLDSPTVAASAGIVNIYFRDPLHQAGGLADFSYGMHEMNRIFLRGDTGDIGQSGIRAFLSYSFTDTKEWRGSGRTKRHHIDFKAVKDLANDSRVELMAMYNLGFGGNPYRSPTMVQWRQYGDSFNFDSTYTKNDTAYWRLQTNPFENLLVSGPSTFNFGDRFAVNLTPYFYYGYGGSRGGATLSESGENGAPGFYDGNQGYSLDLNGNGTRADHVLTYDPFISKEVRPGIVAKANYQLANHALLIGYWYEYGYEQQWQRSEKVASDGSVGDYFGQQNLVILPNGQALASQFQATTTNLHTAFIGDTISLLQDKVSVDLGAKQVWISRRGRNDLPGADPDPHLASQQSLPRAAIRWQPDQSSQLFASVSTNVRAPINNVLFQSFGLTTGKLSAVENRSLASEYSISEELGYRYRNPLLAASLSLFNYNFTNHQVATTVYQNGAPYSAFVNAGGMTSRGADAEIGFNGCHHFKPFLSGEFLQATTDNNIQSGADYLPTAGKTAVRSPKWQFGLGLDYDDGTVFGSLTYKYIDKTYSTFINDESIPSHGQADLALGYRLPTTGPIKRPELRLNLINITDSHYLTGVDGISGNAHAVRGVYHTIIAASSPTYFTEAPFTVLGTIALPF